MKKIIYPGAFIALAAVAVGYHLTSSPKPKAKPQPTISVVQVKDNPDADFDYKLFQEVAKENAYGNTFVSPITTYMGLSMIYNGAMGVVKDDLAKALGAEGVSLEKFNAGNQKTLDSYGPKDGSHVRRNLHPKIRGRDKAKVATIAMPDWYAKAVKSVEDRNFQISMASSIWARSGYRLNQDFVDTNRKYYSAEVKSLDFFGPSAVDTINDWIKGKTKGKIDKLLDDLDPAEALVVINTVYFKAKWDLEFDPKDTHPGDFTLADGNAVSVDMMSLVCSFAYAKEDGFQLLEIPYVGDANMVVVLPDNADDIPGILSQLDSNLVNKLMKNADKCTVRLKLPKFNMDCRTELNASLKSLGLSSIFEPGSGFSGIGGGGIFVSNVIQRAKVKVDEYGTEAAAANAIAFTLVGPTSPPVKIVDFVVNRPFVFVVRAKGKTLFTGLVADPRD